MWLEMAQHVKLPLVTWMPHQNAREEPWLLCFQSSLLLMCLGEQWVMVQAVPYHPRRQPGTGLLASLGQVLAIVAIEEVTQ